MSGAETTLREFLDKILDERGHRPREIDVKVITSGGANYTSTLFNVNVSSPNSDDLKLFAKVACMGKAMRSRTQSDWLYTTERFVYTKLVKIYEDIQEEKNVPIVHRFVFPKFYGCIAELEKETVVMEDLIATGYKSYNRLNAVDWDHASVAVENLAKFHALSFAFEKYRPEEFKKLIPHMDCLIGNSGEEPDEAIVAVSAKIINNALEVIKDEHKERVRKFVDTHQLFEKYNKPIGKPVIAHGDYRLSNLLFRMKNETLETIAVDYQTVHAGCPAGDLIYFIFIGSDEEFRRKYYEQLLDHYFTNLEQALERLSVDTSVYTREKFDSDIKELLPYAVLIGVMILPVVTVEAESAPKVEGGADVEDFVMKPNKLYAQRFSGIVNDCIRWGAI